MTNLFWYLRLTLTLTAVNMTPFTTEVLTAELGAGEWEAVAVLAASGTFVPVSPSRERW